jgi:hypothetical protein
MDTTRGAAMNAVVRHPPTCRRRARARRRWLVVLLVAIFTIALGAGFDEPASDARALVVADAA